MSVTGDPTKVKVSIGFTANIGDFNSVRVDVGIEDHRRDGESMAAAVDRVYKFVEKELESRLDETMKEIKKKTHGS